MIAPKWLRRVRLALPAVGLAILIVILARLDREAMLAQLSHISVVHFVLAAGMFVMNVLLKFVRWLRILRTYDIVLPLREGLLAFFASIFYGMVTVGGVGELTRTGVLIARDVHWSRALVSCLFDRVLDVALLSIIGAVALIHLYLPADGQLLALATLAAVTVAGLLGGPRLLQWCAASVTSWPFIRRMPSQAERLRLAPGLMIQRVDDVHALSPGTGNGARCRAAALTPVSARRRGRCVQSARRRHATGWPAVRPCRQRGSLPDRAGADAPR